jgi:secreted PhoX family phosphatase
MQVAARNVNRRSFLAGSAAVGGGLAVVSPLQAFAERAASGGDTTSDGYGPLINKGDLSLPRGFRYRIISRSGETMSDGNPTPTSFDGMATFRGGGGNTILVRNHENRESTGDVGEIDVVVPADKRYDSNPSFNAGVTKLVVNDERRVVRDFAALGGTSTNCAGGKMPWRSWITCEEVFQDGEERHGYVFEVPADARGPVEPEPIRAAGRFVHEAVAWHQGILYLTEDRRFDSAFFRFLPNGRPQEPGDLARLGGELQALKIADVDNANTDGWPIGEPFAIEWVTITEPDPDADIVRDEAHDNDAAAFNRQEGMWVGNDRVYFDCTEGGVAGLGQVWELNPDRQTLTLIYESPDRRRLKNPDNIVVAPTGDLFLCEDSDPPQFIRGLTPRGRIYDFARANTREAEFAGVCFDPDRRTMYVNQFGDPEIGEDAVTYAIWGPWGRRID